MTEHVHRRNDDGSWDSICIGCFRTIARAEAEAELTERERKHVCRPMRISQRRPPSAFYRRCDQNYVNAREMKVPQCRCV
jgi:predicted Fe-S protein YdhL (DUF1289 family)